MDLSRIFRLGPMGYSIGKNGAILVIIGKGFLGSSIYAFVLLCTIYFLHLFLDIKKL